MFIAISSFAQSRANTIIIPKSITVFNLFFLHRRDYLRLKNVGLSNILDGELVGREPVERSHGEVVGAAVMDSELLGKVVE